MNEIQRRVSLTSNVIAGMKNLKISGLTTPITSFVQQLRVNELFASKEVGPLCFYRISHRGKTTCHGVNSNFARYAARWRF